MGTKHLWLQSYTRKNDSFKVLCNGKKSVLICLHGPGKLCSSFVLVASDETVSALFALVSFRGDPVRPGMPRISINPEELYKSMVPLLVLI